ncbi:MAG: glycerophosphoryl diester phosphodiesterase [Magnetospirillum sp. WYHS-4]
MPHLEAIIGHRGAAGCAPENTLASLREAARQGAHWVEFDVKLSRDGVPVLFHDERLERTTNGRGRLSRLSLAELRRLDAGGGETVPTLAEAMDLLRLLDMGANVELKPCPGREVETARAAAAVLAGTPVPVLLSSFSEAALAAVPDWPLALVVGRIPADWRSRLERLGARALHCRQGDLRRRQVEEVRTAGLSLRCYTVNDPARARRLLDWGVVSVFTDFPGRLLEAIGRSPVPAPS